MCKKTIPLSDYFNHKIFEEDCDKQKHKKIVTYEDTIKKLNFECETEIFDLADGKFDNIQCKEAVTIPVCFECKTVHMLCFAEWGEFSEEVTFIYSDGNALTKRCIIPQYEHYYWFKDTYQNGVWKNSWNFGRVLRPYLRTSRTDGGTGYLYDVTIEVSDIEGKIKYITLPQNEFVHIFAITCET